MDLATIRSILLVNVLF